MNLRVGEPTSRSSTIRGASRAVAPPRAAGEPNVSSSRDDSSERRDPPAPTDGMAPTNGAEATDGNPAVAADDARELRRAIAVHRGSRLSASLFQLGTTVGLYLLGWACMWWSLSLGYWAALLLAVPTGGMLMRMFILQHDCGHGALFAKKSANQIVGVLLGALTMTPYECWRRQHALHHATNGQLDHRGSGDVTLLTLREYGAATAWQRWRYRCYRHPLILFCFGPLLFFVFMQRLPWIVPKSWKRERASILITNGLMALLFSAGAYLMGPMTFFKLQLPVMWLAAAMGSWLFFVQHQFNPTYWRRDGGWDHGRAAIEGSSFLDLPRPLHWLTANIGYHHIHHLDSRIPNYALPACHAEHAELQSAPSLTLVEGMRCLRLKLWDEARQELITFRQAKRRLLQQHA